MLNLFLPEIRLQIAAVTLADQLNFSRAADLLNITQPALSKQIAELERRLSFFVFERRPKGVELTEAGKVFVRGCRDSLAILEKAVRTARTTHEEMQPVVTIGHSPYVDPKLIAELLGTQLPLYPNLRLRMESRFPSELTHGVLSAELDLAIIEDAVPTTALTRVDLRTAQLYALMSRDHDSAKRHAVTLEDFRKVGWMMFPKRANPILYDRIFNAARQIGVAPVELHHYMAPQEVIQLIMENFGVAFMPKGIAQRIQTHDIVCREFSSKDFRITSHLVLRADQTSRLVNEFGRAFLRRVCPTSKVETSEQLSFEL